MKYDPNRHHRRSTRLSGYDYSQAGAYFVTILTRHRECLFGSISDTGEQSLDMLGQLVEMQWMSIPSHCPFVELDEFIVMPNHLHGIVVITVSPHTVRANKPFDTVSINSRQHGGVYSPLHATDNGLDPDVVCFPKGTKPRSVGAVIQAFKKAVSRRANGFLNRDGISIWHRNYHDHIIRNEDELNRIREYMTLNPARWAEDKNNPANLQRAPVYA